MAAHVRHSWTYYHVEDCINVLFSSYNKLNANQALQEIVVSLSRFT